MLCSACNKNMAVIYINTMTKDKDGKQNTITEGLCIDCAKSRGINPLDNLISSMANIDEEQMKNINSQFDKLLNSLDPQTLERMENSMGMDSFSNMFSETSKDSPDDYIKTDEGVSTEEKKKKNKVRKTKYLDEYGTNLTQKARDNKLDSVIGRDKELQRMIQILNRRSKNNPALIGEPGVGKTAIVNALAIAMAKGEVPNKLVDKELYLIDMTSLVAGTQFRGQFEARVKGLIDECKSFGNIILAIDEIHNIVGGLEHDNAMNAANMLKPALANGDIQLIGATTLKEYRQHIEKDSALERRFQPIIVDEPNFDDTFKILQGTKKYYENFHKVTIPDEILKQAINLSNKYIHDRYQPDKSIDLLDEACSRVNLEDILLAQLEKLQNSFKTLQEEKDEMEEKIENAENSNNIDTKDYETLAILKERECKIQTKIENINKKIKPREVGYEDLARVVELWTKIPVSRIQKSESEKLLNLKNALRQRIIGQDQAIEVISNAILRKRAGIKTILKPPSFIFVGPTGVGKTALVKALAYELFDNEDAVIHLDMSEYMESHSISKLIGSPPGYVGYDEAGKLTEKVRRNPYSIILFDEIEKAHQSIYNLLLQILDEGKLTDSQGRTVSFKHTIVVLTSNLGTNFKNDSYGFANLKSEDEVQKSKVNDSLKEFFTPEFLNRVDDIIVFNRLTKENLEKIAEIMIKELQKETKERNIIFTYTPQVIQYILKNGYNDKFGARPLKRAIQKYIEDLIAIKYTEGKILENKEFKLQVENDVLEIEKA